MSFVLLLFLILIFFSSSSSPSWSLSRVFRFFVVSRSTSTSVPVIAPFSFSSSSSLSSATGCIGSSIKSLDQFKTLLLSLFLGERFQCAREREKRWLHTNQRREEPSRWSTKREEPFTTHLPTDRILLLFFYPPRETMISATRSSSSGR